MKADRPMTEEASQIAHLSDNFYREGFGQIIFIVTAICLAIATLIAASVYIHVTKPKPIVFVTADDWRVMPSLPTNQPYLSESDLLQWVSETLPNAFNYDFLHYDDQLKKNTQYFTQDGLKVYSNQLNIYVSRNNVLNSKLFVSGQAAGAPFILNEGLLLGRYAWWVQMPVDMTYTNNNRTTLQSLTFQVLVVRVPTENNLSGVQIDNVIVVKNTNNGAPTGG